MGKKRLSRMQSKKKKAKIKKKVNAHNKKVRRLAKKMGLRKRMKKDPGIPKIYPFKKEMLEEIQEKKSSIRLANDTMMLQKQEERNMKKSMQSRQNEFYQFQFQAQQNLRDFQQKQELLTEHSQKYSQNVRNLKEQTSKFFKDFKKVVEQSDVIIEVLDARDPLGCRSISIEKQILSSGLGNKRLILLLNKIDLVPQEVVKKWLEYFRQELPTYPFKSATQKQKNNYGHSNFTKNANDAPSYLRFGGKCLGKENLIKVLKNYCRSSGIKKAITVGIIGYPNVGKSSVINSLRGKRVANVGSKPGITSQMQLFKFDKTIQFLDCPGIIFDNKRTIDTDIILRNCVEIDKLSDTITPVDIIRKRCTNERLMKRYKVPFFKTTEEFLTQIAYKAGRLLKGGKPNLFEAGKIVLRDWNDGKIPFFTIPPSRQRFQNNRKIEVEWGVVDDNSVLKKISSLKDKRMDELIPMLSSMTI